MVSLLKVFLIISAIFASTFVLMNFTNLLTISDIEHWLNQATTLSPIYIGGIIAILLFADLFIAMPTLTICLLSGYFLGHTQGAIAALSGILLAGVCGYVISRYYGKNILGFLLKDEDKRNDAIRTFQDHGFVMILLSRAMPILPEASACLSGMTKMPFGQFFLAWLISSVPYVLIATYAGAISSFENPKPAVFTAIGITTFLWIAWYVYHRFNKKVSIH